MHRLLQLRKISSFKPKWKSPQSLWNSIRHLAGTFRPPFTSPTLFLFFIFLFREFSFSPGNVTPSFLSLLVGWTYWIKNLFCFPFNRVPSSLCFFLTHCMLFCLLLSLCPSVRSWRGVQEGLERVRESIREKMRKGSQPRPGISSAVCTTWAPYPWRRHYRCGGLGTA